MTKAGHTADIGLATSHAKQAAKDTGYPWVVVMRGDGPQEKRYMSCAKVEWKTIHKSYVHLIYDSSGEVPPTEEELAKAYQMGYRDGKGDNESAV